MSKEVIILNNKSSKAPIIEIRLNYIRNHCNLDEHHNSDFLVYISLILVLLESFAFLGLGHILGIVEKIIVLFLTRFLKAHFYQYFDLGNRLALFTQLDV